jgi:hypothetical protein
MEDFKSLKQLIQSYLRLRKIMRIFEGICLLAVLFVYLNSRDRNLVEFIGCAFAIIIVLESFLAIQRWKVKASINGRKDAEENWSDHFSKQKEETEKMKNELISHESDSSLNKKSLDIIQKEKHNSGWMTFRIEHCKFMCSKSMQVIDQLNELKRLVIF